MEDHVGSDFDDSRSDDRNAWIVTYGDLMTLLLVFFVLLYSISSLNLHKFKHALNSIQMSLGETNPRVGLMDLVNVPEANDQNFTIEDLTGLRSREQEILSSLNSFIEGETVVKIFSSMQRTGKSSLKCGAKCCSPRDLLLLVIPLLRFWMK